MTEVHHGLEGVVAFETQIAEPDKEGSALRYRGVDIEDIVGRVPFENVWGLLIDGAYTPGLAPAEPYNLPVHTGDVRVDVQAAIAMLAPALGFRQTYDITDEQAREDIGRLAVMVLSYAAQSARGLHQPVVPQKIVDEGATLAEKFLIRWKGEADPKHVKAIDAYWSSAAEHGMNASTFTARVITSTGADVAAAFSGAIGAMSGPLHGGAPSRVLGMIEEVEQRGDARAYVKELLDNGERLMGFGHRVYRAEDPRARGAAPHRARARRAALPGRRGAGAGRAGGAAGAPSRPRARDQRRVLGRHRARLRRGTGPDVHVDVHLRPHRRLVGAHPRAEAHGSPDPPVRRLHRPGRAPGLRRRGLGRRLGEVTPRSSPATRDRRPHRYQPVRPLAPSQLSEMCTWSTWRSVGEQVATDEHEAWR
ncbi:hypothetical protein QE405_002236 [Nocardioides zeae]|uniref:Uncharacterized protein n=1 Tax=Nocardioides zeae TaxID=1457234 RepID=A0AAJ1U7R4_9ACTN|nr:hypothetical protein [Nocardioides zeae]